MNKIEFKGIVYSVFTMSGGIVRAIFGVDEGEIAKGAELAKYIRNSDILKLTLNANGDERSFFATAIKVKMDDYLGLLFTFNIMYGIDEALLFLCTCKSQQLLVDVVVEEANREEKYGLGKRIVRKSGRQTEEGSESSRTVSKRISKARKDWERAIDAEGADGSLSS